MVVPNLISGGLVEKSTGSQLWLRYRTIFSSIYRHVACAIDFKGRLSNRWLVGWYPCICRLKSPTLFYLGKKVLNIHSVLEDSHRRYNILCYVGINCEDDYYNYGLYYFCLLLSTLDNHPRNGLYLSSPFPQICRVISVPRGITTGFSGFCSPDEVSLSHNNSESTCRSSNRYPQSHPIEKLPFGVY